LEDDISDPSTSPLVPNSVQDYQLRYYDYERDRAGIGTNIELTMDKNDKLYANVLYAGYDEYRNPALHTVYENIDAIAANGAIVNADGSITIPDVTVPGVDVKKTMTDELTQFRTLATGLGGENNLGGFILDYKASFSYTDQDVPWNYNYSFKNTNITGSFTYNNSTNNGNSPTINLSGLSGQNDATQYLLTGQSNSTSTYQVAQYGGKADGKFAIPLRGDDASTVIFGAAARLEYSTFTSASFDSASLSPLTKDKVLGSTSTPFYPGNIYDLGPVPGLTQTTNLLNNTNVYQGPYVQTDPNGDKGGEYNNWEDVYAGYAMYTLKSGPMEVMTGARLEATHIQYNWWQAYYYQQGTNAASATFVDPGPGLNYSTTELPSPISRTGDIDYANVLPSLGFKYAFNPDLTTRINYSQTIARPTQSQYIPAFSLGQALSAQANNSNVAFTFGN